MFEIQYIILNYCEYLYHYQTLMRPFPHNVTRYARSIEIQRPEENFLRALKEDEFIVERKPASEIGRYFENHFGMDISIV